MQAVYHVNNASLSWRKRAAFLRHLPESSAVAGIGRDGPRWSVEAHLLDDVRMWLMRLCGAEIKDIKPHPQRPIGAKPIDPARQKKLADARRRAKERRRRIAAGEIT